MHEESNSLSDLIHPKTNHLTGMTKTYTFNQMGQMKCVRQAQFWKLLIVLALPFFWCVIISTDLLADGCKFSSMSREVKDTEILGAEIISDEVFEPAKTKVLITGIAGFIGYSLASELTRKKVAKIVGIDHFNSYYDVRLKYKRIDMLSHYDSIDIIQGDVCNASLVRKVLYQHNFSHVVHLAAQAGVRYSLQKPLSYVRENVECFVTLLEEVRHLKEKVYPVPRLLYASSSSVYGSNTKIPFEEVDRVDSPSSLYGATKRMNELLATVYFNIFGISSVGLRFFTVYGPWGRPDMAPFLFTDRIEKGESVVIYNKGKMERDFTYIDDIIGGIVSALNVAPSSATVVNLGNNQPQSVLSLVKIIEEKLNRSANLEFKTSVVDLPITYASINKAQKLLSYAPKTNLEEGMEKFINWYLLYTQARMLCASECAQQKRCLRSPFDAAAALSSTLTEGCTFVVYTVYIGVETTVSFHEPFHAAKNRHNSSCYIAFSTSVLNETARAHSKWNMVPLTTINSIEWDTRRLSRVIKLTPGGFFAPSVREAIYVDAKYQLCGDPRKLVDMLRDQSGQKSAILVAIHHPLRSNPSSERAAIMWTKQKRPDISYSMWTMKSQIDSYEGFEKSENISLSNMIDGGFLVHDLTSPIGREFRCAWSNEYYKGADRDQLSFPFVLAVKAKRAGVSFSPDEEWCKVQDSPEKYVRILPAIFHPDHKFYEIISKKDFTK